jgi:hypothetical protein
MTFSGGGFFAYSPIDPGSPSHKQGIWWSSFSRADPDVRTVDEDAISRAVVGRHEKWSDPTVREILEKVKRDRLGFKVATWVTPKAPTWAGKAIVLVGDAAHGKSSSRFASAYYSHSTTIQHYHPHLVKVSHKPSKTQKHSPSFLPITFENNTLPPQR